MMLGWANSGSGGASCESTFILPEKTLRQAKNRQQKMPTQAKILVTHQSGLKCLEDCIFLVYKSKKILIVRRPAGGKWISKVGWG